MKYTLETLLAGNKTYDFYYHLHEQDVAKVNRLIDRIEASRAGQTTPAPLDGDAVICLHPTEGEVSTDARLEKPLTPGRLLQTVRELEASREAV